MADVLLERVSKRFGDVVAVDDLTIHVQDREFLVLVGPSGCGKTTTLRMIAGLDDVTSGRILIGDRDVTDVLPKDRDIAMVFQSYALYPHMSVFDNMAFALRLRNVPKGEIDRRVKQTADLLGIGDLLNRKPRQLSGGQRQRVAVGRAIVRNPRVFLMDEPLSNLDAKLRVQTRAELIKLHRRLEATVVYVTHDQVEAMTMGTRIAVMKDGVLQQLDTPQTIYERPANTFVAEFIGSPAMNFLGGRIEGSSDAAWVELPGLRLPLSDQQRRRWASRLGQPVIAGVRPEHIVAGPGSNEDRRVGDGRIEVVELLGNEAIFYIKVGDADLVSRQPYHSGLKAGQSVPVAVDVERLHLFDPVSRRTIA